MINCGSNYRSFKIKVIFINLCKFNKYLFKKIVNIDVSSKYYNLKEKLIYV